MAQIQYFLGANAPSGFYSLYDQLIDLDTARAVYLLKGGPGCGKSSLMRRVARHAEAAGYSVQYILCAGDPDSLDAIVIPERAVAFVDATAPHIIEPKYPGVVEHYVNLGAYYDAAGLQSVRSAVREDMLGYKEHYKRCYRCLFASSELDSDLRELLLTSELSAKLAKRARGIISREIKGDGTGGTVQQRFLSGVTHRGMVCCWETVEAQCRRVYELCDSYGLAHALLSPILTAATARGYDVVACPCPLAPDRLEHLLIPDLGLAFLTSNSELAYPGRPYRRIHLDSLATGEIYRKHRPRIRFTRKVSAALKEEAILALSQAKAQHDELEAHYNPFVDFDGVYGEADRLAELAVSGDTLKANPKERPAN